MKISLLGSAVVLALCVAGCEHNCFEIEIRPDGQAFQRRLSGWHEGGKEPRQRLPAADLARLAKLYAKRESAENAVPSRSSAADSPTTPRKIWAGLASTRTSPRRWVPPLHTSSAFAATTTWNPTSQNAAEGRSTDRPGAGWLTAELGHDPNFPRLKNFLDEDLREDLKNLGVYAWTSSEAGQGQLQPMTEFLARVGLYLCQRGYFSPQQIPKLFRAFDQHDPAPLLAHIQRFVARKMGVPDTAPIPPSLAFLGDPQRLAASLTNYVRSSDLFRERVVAWKAAKHDKADAKEPSPNEFLDALAAPTVLGNSELRLMHSEDTLDLKVVCGQKPYATNGGMGRSDRHREMVPNDGPESDPAGGLFCPLEHAQPRIPEPALRPDSLGR